MLLQFNKCILSCTISFKSFNNNGDNAPSKMFLENEKLHIFFVTIFRLFSTISILFVNSIMLAIFDSMFLIIFFLTIRPRCFLIIRDSLLVVTSLSIPHSRLRHRSKTLCRSYAKLGNSISPDVRKLPKFKFRKTLRHCLVKILIQEDGCVAMTRIVAMIL